MFGKEPKKIAQENFDRMLEACSKMSEEDRIGCMQAMHDQLKKDYEDYSEVFDRYQKELKDVNKMRVTLENEVHSKFRPFMKWALPINLVCVISPICRLIFNDWPEGLFGQLLRWVPSSIIWINFAVLFCVIPLCTLAAYKRNHIEKIESEKDWKKVEKDYEITLHELALYTAYFRDYKKN